MRRRRSAFLRSHIITRKRYQNMRHALGGSCCAEKGGGDLSVVDAETRFVLQPAAVHISRGGPDSSCGRGKSQRFVT